MPAQLDTDILAPLLVAAVVGIGVSGRIIYALREEKKALAAKVADLARQIEKANEHYKDAVNRLEAYREDCIKRDEEIFKKVYDFHRKSMEKLIADVSEMAKNASEINRSFGGKPLSDEDVIKGILRGHDQLDGDKPRVD